MIARLAATVLALALAALPLAAEEKVVAGLSQNSISITAQFTGSDILIYGAVKRESPIPDGPPLDVIVTLQGPSAPVTVRHKSRVGGVWVNTDSVRVDLAPSYYSVATSAPLGRILTQTEDLRHRVSVPLAIRSVGAPSQIVDAPAFSDALIRLRMRDGLYSVDENSVDVVQQTLFRADFDLPANLTEGNYTVRILLLRDRSVLDEQTEVIRVSKVGLERWLYATSRNEPALYGLLALAIAVFAGWAAAAVFRFVRT